jgi:hypothetical protein
LDDLRRRPELPVFHALPVQAMARDADGVVQVVKLLAVEPDGLLATPAKPLRPGGETKRDALLPVSLFNNDFDLLIFAV